MSWFRNASVRGKLMFLSLAPSLSILALAGITFITLDLYFYRDALKADLQATGQFIARTTRAALAFQDVETATRILDGLAAKESILQAVIYDADSEVFATFNPSNEDLPRADAEWNPGLQPGGRQIVYLHPIKTEGRRLGTLYLASSMQGAYDRLAAFTAIAAGALLLFSWLAYWIASRLQGVIAAPILNLATTARRVSEKQDYSLRATKSSEDEVGFLTDAFNQMLQQIENTVGELEAFSYTVSHDLRAPLRAMQGYSHALMEDFGDQLDDQAKDYLRRISVSGKRLDGLIQDVLTYSRVIRSEASPAPVSLDKLVTDILRHYPAFEGPGIDVQVSKPLHSVNGQETLLTQCVANLLDNATKFVAPGVKPVVKIWSESKSGKVRLWIEDNGIGIDPKYQKRIFRMFERIHRDGEYSGTGIGLSIVGKAMERMGGAVGLESSPGKGSRFWLELPAAS